MPSYPGNSVPEQVRHALSLWHWRKGKGWTQEQAAGWYGVSARTWRRYECAEVRIPKPLSNRIAATTKRENHQ